MAASSFYLTLPSNSSAKHYTNNTAGHYFTQLPQTIDVRQDGGDEYEVGLSEISFSNMYCNVKPLTYMLSFRYDGQQTMVTVPGGLYLSIKKVIGALKEGLQEAMNETGRHNAVSLTYDENSRRAKLRVIDPKVSIRLSDQLADFMQMSERELFAFNSTQQPGHVVPQNYYESERMMRMSSDFEAVYVYTDLIEHRVVGDVLAPLLRVIPVSKTDGDMVHRVFTKPHYAPLLRTRFDSIEILLSADTGEPLVFEGGKTIVTLHIRRRRL